MANIWVTAGDGRETPVPTSIATAPGAQLLKLKPGVKLEVDDAHPFTQRALRNGDFVRTTAPAEAVEKKER